jgi:hypothetical protein
MPENLSMSVIAMLRQLTEPPEPILDTLLYVTRNSDWPPIPIQI